ncbi:alpha/beta hydrolase [Microbacterium sp. STN6]|uniref:esterase/lipase family protein n=1 Tax=Microbacterium sp. STN6 TaxID=2995588 RepID=UPI002260EFEC|nr:alpha/beta hydrolase [Microbacterium sp. STN6]MCX7523444.1 alpha/beta hydrolase [Microbacterium sp. STN6]
MLYASRAQLEGTFSRDDPGMYERPAPGVAQRRAVLLLQGVFETWHFMRPIATLLHERGHPVYVVPQLGHNRAQVRQAASVVERFIVSRGLGPIAVVAHSKGGLIAKYLMVNAPQLIDMTIAVSTPFSGSRYAMHAPTATLREFAPGDETTRTLASNRDANARITSVFGIDDYLIPDGSRLDGAVNVCLPVPGHFRILSDARLHRVLERVLDGQRGAPLLE